MTYQFNVKINNKNTNETNEIECDEYFFSVIRDAPGGKLCYHQYNIEHFTSCLALLFEIMHACGDQLLLSIDSIKESDFKNDLKKGLESLLKASAMFEYKILDSSEAAGIERNEN